MAHETFQDPAVAAAFDRYPPDVRSALMRMRGLILTTAAQSLRVGEVVETLKWGQPAYLPARPRVGTTVRIDAVAGTPGAYAMYFHCQTSLLATFRDLYPDAFTFEGDRALVFSTAHLIPENAVKHCVALALGYHLRAAA